MNASHDCVIKWLSDSNELTKEYIAVDERNLESIFCEIIADNLKSAEMSWLDDDLARSEVSDVSGSEEEDFNNKVISCDSSLELRNKMFRRFILADANFNAKLVNCDLAKRLCKRENIR